MSWLCHSNDTGKEHVTASEALAVQFCDMRRAVHAKRVEPQACRCTPKALRVPAVIWPS
jgi:hypothetical protein